MTYEEYDEKRRKYAEENNLVTNFASLSDCVKVEADKKWFARHAERELELIGFDFGDELALTSTYRSLGYIVASEEPFYERTISIWTQRR